MNFFRYFLLVILISLFSCKIEQKICNNVESDDIHLEVCYKNNFVEYKILNSSNNSILCDTSEIMKGVVYLSNEIKDTSYYSYSNYNYGADRGGIEMVLPISEIKSKNTFSKKFYIPDEDVRFKEIQFDFYYLINDTVSQSFNHPELFINSPLEINTMDFGYYFKIESVKLKIK